MPGSIFTRLKSWLSDNAPICENCFTNENSVLLQKSKLKVGIIIVPLDKSS